MRLRAAARCISIIALLASVARAAPPPATGSDPATTSSPTPPSAADSPAVIVPPSVEPSAAAGTDPATLKLREIEERVNQLKERVFQSKARLVQLQEVVLNGSIAGAKLVLMHRNEMGGSFKLAHVQYALDGTVIFNRAEADVIELDKQEETEAFNGPVAPGNHQLSVYMEYVGNGFGVFNYLEGYKFKVKSSHTFLADEGKVTTVRIVGFEKGGITTQLQDRPSVRFDVGTPTDLQDEAAPAAAETPR